MTLNELNNFIQENNLKYASKHPGYLYLIEEVKMIEKNGKFYLKISVYSSFNLHKMCTFESIISVKSRISKFNYTYYKSSNILEGTINFEVIDSIVDDAFDERIYILCDEMKEFKPVLRRD